MACQLGELTAETLETQLPTKEAASDHQGTALCHQLPGGVHAELQLCPGLMGHFLVVFVPGLPGDKDLGRKCPITYI